MRIWPALLLMLIASLGRAEEVDVELALMVDVSRSMSIDELEVQRRGYAEAIASDEVVGAILNGFTGKIAVTYVEWAGQSAHRIIVPWRVIASAEDAQAIADALTAEFSFAMRRTSISGAVAYAARDMEANRFVGLRRVIDISGDGPNNDGGPVLDARDAAVAAGYIINGLPIMTEEPNPRWGIDDLDIYYENCVIGGPGAFAIPVFDWSDFPMVVRRKIVLELAGPPEAVFAQAQAGGYDCLIGEKMRRARESSWDLP